MQKEGSTPIGQSRLVEFGRRSGLLVHPVSIGAMRLPDEEAAIPLMRQAIDAGMIYIDTSRGYGDSEIKVGKSLKDGYREEVILSTKCSPWILKVEPDDDTSAECTYKRILESLQRLDVDYLDFYQIWNIDSLEHYQQVIAKGGMLDGIRRAMKQGLVKHTGFTTHDTPENISRYIDEADWCEAILFTHNIMNPTYKQVIAQAHQKGIATIVMNPLGGGMLAEASPVLQAPVKELLALDDVIEVAHRYLAGDKNIDTILCGITRPHDITSTVANYQKPPLTPDQRHQLEIALEKLTSENMGFCTACKYCLPCPQGIYIPGMMNVVYQHRLLQVPRRAKLSYGFLKDKNNPNYSADPSECTQCGECEEKCTQKIKITAQLQYLQEIMPFLLGNSVK